MGESALRIMVVANKTWEVEPLLAVLQSRKARPEALKGGSLGFHPYHCEMARECTMIQPRLALRVEGGSQGHATAGDEGEYAAHRTERAEVQVWCIEDWMKAENHSSSRDKWESALPTIKEASASSPDVVIAFGTAAIPSAASRNGCVTLGSRVFICDPYAGRSSADRRAGTADPMLDLAVTGYGSGTQPLESPRLHPDFFRTLSVDARHAAEARFLRAPLAPADPPVVLAGHGFASLGVINVTDYDDYVWTDALAIQGFRAATDQNEIGSVETTHGLIRLAWPESTFLYVSGLADRVGGFDLEVAPRDYAQNFVAAHNAGVLVAHLLPQLVVQHGFGKLFSGPRM